MITRSVAVKRPQYSRWFKIEQCSCAEKPQQPAGQELEDVAWMSR